MASRFSGVRASLTPPGTTQVGWIFLPPRVSMMVWPIWRSRIPSLARAGSWRMTPKMLRVAGSESQPSSKSGEERWKKDRAWDWVSWARFMIRRSFSAVGGMLTESR